MRAYLKNPFLISIGSHVAVVLFFVVSYAGPNTNPEAAQPVPIELVLTDPGSLLQQTEDGDPDEQDLKNQEPARPAARDQGATEKPTLPDDLEYAEKPALPLPTVASPVPAPVPAPAPAPVLTQAAPLPLTAPDLALSEQAEYNAVFNPKGEAKTEDRSAAQSRADSGSPDVVEPVSTPHTETKASAVAESSPTAGEDGFLLTSTGGDVPLPRFKPNVQKPAEAAEKPDLASLQDPKRADAGVETPDPKESDSGAKEGPDALNIAARTQEPDAKKVTTPVPKPKPRALARAFKRKRQQALEAEKTATAQRNEQEQPRSNPNSGGNSGPGSATDVASGAEDAALTNQLNDQMLALLNRSEETAVNQNTPQTGLSDLVEELNAQQIDTDRVAAVESTAASQAGTGALSLLSPSEVARIADQISNAWLIPPGAEFSTVPSITLRVEVGRDGTILNVQAKNRLRYEQDPVYKHAADGAISSVLSTSPWDVPTGVPYETWRFFEPTFELADFIGE